jgi:3-hydroxymyristoyl/3-hydroxydecanoyl-(acyl carrier protein) dehydratase
MRYVLLDRITELSPTRAVGAKCVSLGEDVFAEHFPGLPVMPGALIIESMAQLGGVVVEAASRAKSRDDLFAVLTGVDRVKFRRRVVPGDRLDLVAEVVYVSEMGGAAKVEARVEGALVTSTELTYVLTELPDKLAALRREQLAIWRQTVLVDALGKSS